jgi:uncharacterized protein with von Willebrand factor type A (vWA) domain
VKPRLIPGRRRSASPASRLPRPARPGFIVELREAGLPVSLTENLDAMEAVQHIPLEDREAFKYALAATLVKNNAHWRVFETVFEVYFSLRGSGVLASTTLPRPTWPRCSRTRCRAGLPARAAGRRARGRGRGDDPRGARPDAVPALLKGDEAMMRAIARQAVQRFAGMEPGRPVGGTYYLYRTLRNLDLDGVLDKLMEASQGGRRRADPARGAAGADEYEHRIEQF